MTNLSDSFRKNNATLLQTRYSDLIALLIVAAVLVFYLATIRPGHGWGDDFAQYIIHAKNIVSGIPYKKTGHIMNSIYSIAPETYPPVFPLLLAPVYYLTGFQIDALKIPGILCFCGFLLLFYYVFKNSLPAGLRIAGMILMALNPYFWDSKDAVLSEFPFIFFLFLALLLIKVSDKSISQAWKTVVLYFFIGVSIYLVVGTRSIGIVLLPSFLLYELIKKDKKKYWFLLVILATAVTSLLLLLEKQYLNSTGDGYLFQLKRYFSLPEVIQNIGKYETDFRLFWTGNDEGYIGQVVYYFMAVLAIAGFILRISKRITIIEIFFCAYVAGTFLWPMYQAMRFLMPVAPLFLFYILYSVNALPAFLASRAKTLQYLLLTLTGLSYLLFQINFDYSKDVGFIERPESEELFNFISYTPADSRFIFEKPRALTLYADRQAGVAPYCTENLKDLGHYFYNAKINYLVLFKWDQSCSVEFTRAYPELAQKVFENNMYLVYKLSTQPF